MIWRGEVYQIDLGQPVGHEPAFHRPGVVVSSDLFNNGAGGLVVIVPVASVSYGLRSYIELEVGASGLEHRSYARCDQIWSCPWSGSRRGGERCRQASSP